MTKTASLSSMVVSAAKTATFSTVADGFPASVDEAIIYVDVTAASGTTPTLDIIYQTSNDGGTTWFDHTTFTQITGTGKATKPITNVGLVGRLQCTIGGTTPSFTFSAVMGGKRHGG